MKFGTKKTVYNIDANSSISKIEKYRNGQVEHTIKHYKIRIKINDSQQEMTEFIKFTSEINKHRDDNTLVTDKEDKTTLPAFIIDYPKEKTDGGYYIIKSYCVIG